MIRKFLLIAFVCFLLVVPASLAQAKMVSVDADMINLRSGPGSKHKVLWELGRGYPLELTFSCMAPVNDGHCGACNKCEERRIAFRDANMVDPTDYHQQPLATGPIT